MEKAFCNQHKHKLLARELFMKNQIGQKTGRITLFVILSCMMAGMGGVNFGYDIGISGGLTSMEPFLKMFFPYLYHKMKEDSNLSNYCLFDSQLLTSFTSSLYVSGLFTSFFASHITSNYGRKPSIIVGGLAFFAGSVFGSAAFNVYMLIVGRLLRGVGLGFSSQSIPLYLSEMAPPQHRGAISNGFTLSMSIGILTASLINYGTEKMEGDWGWRVSLGFAAFPSLVLVLGAFFLPETPNSIIQCSNNHQNAKLILQRIRGMEDVQAELDDLIEAISMSKTSKQPFKDIFKRKYRPQLVMAIAMPFFQQATGVNMIGFYALLLCRTIGLGESASLISTVLISIVGISAVLVSMVLVDKLGRRTLLIAGSILLFVSQSIIGGIMASQLKDQGGVNKGYAYLVLVCFLIFTFAFACSWGPLGWLIPSEIFPMEIRSAGQSVTVAVNFICTFTIAQTSLAMLCHFKFGIFFFFTAWVVVMTMFVYYFLPESKNVPIELMNKVWKEHWFWKSVTSEVNDLERPHVKSNSEYSRDVGTDTSTKINYLGP